MLTLMLGFWILGITFIHVTHTQLEAIAVADLVVVMAQGAIEQAASAHGLGGLLDLNVAEERGSRTHQGPSRGPSRI